MHGDVAAGIELLQQARQLVQEVGDDVTVGTAPGGFSALSLIRGVVDEAERYAEEYVALAQRTGDVMNMANAAWADGRAMTPEQALAGVGGAS
ncbi:MAG: hypothetical protein JOZ81_21885 [Chloroflexi bacterium]|nr:hypothetical protein [Chloroflexota bacterium]